MEEELRVKVLAQGIEARLIAPGRRLLELRYRGQSSAIAVLEPAAPSAARWRHAFEDEHERLYGHVFGGREVEVAAARIEVTGTIDKAALPARPERERRAEPMSSRRVFTEGEWREAPVYERERLEPGDRLDGPAIVVEATGTTVVEPGWTARLTGRGELILEDRGVARSTAAAKEDPDPVELELFNHRFAAIAEEMGAMLRRTALSVNVKERLDFSCAVFDGSGSLVANAPHMPVHLGAMSETVRCVLRDVPDLGPGDVVLTNDPFRGGSHLPDLTLVTPVFVPDRPTARCSSPPIARTTPRSAASGPVACRPIRAPSKRKGWCCAPWKVVEGGRPRLGELRGLLVAARYPSRAPDENIADVSAQIAANQLGVRRLLELEATAGRETTVAYMRHIQDAAEAKMRAALRRLGDGVYAFADRLDDGAPIAVRIEVRDGGGIARLRRHGAAAAHQPQRQPRDRQGGDPLLLPLPHRRGHPAQRGRAGAARGAHSALGPRSAVERRSRAVRRRSSAATSRPRSA